MSVFTECIEYLEKRKVTVDDIVDCVIYLQKDFIKDIEREAVRNSVISVISKREVQHAILTGINLDIAAEKGILDSDTLSSILVNDVSLYGVDEVLAYGICNLYGSIALTNYGYIDREKPLIIKQLNDDTSQCNCFLDDIVGAIAAAAASRIAHNEREKA